MKSILGQTKPRESSKEGEKQRGKQRVMVTLSSTLDNCAQLTPMAPRWRWHKRGKKTNQRWRTQKPRSHQPGFSFLKCSVGLGRSRGKSTMAFEGAWKIHCNYWVGEKSVRLKDEGPALSLQRDLRLPWADFQSRCREENPAVSHYQSRTSAAKLQWPSQRSAGYIYSSLTFVLISHNIIRVWNKLRVCSSIKNNTFYHSKLFVIYCFYIFLSINPNLFTKDFSIILESFPDTTVFGFQHLQTNDSYVPVALQNQSSTCVDSRHNCSFIAEVNIIKSPLLCLAAVCAIVAFSAVCWAPKPNEDFMWTNKNAPSHTWCVFAPALQQIFTLVRPQMSFSHHFCWNCCLYRTLVALE